MIKKNIFLLVFLTLFSCLLFSQKKDSIDLKNIDNELKKELLYVKEMVSIL